MRKFSKILTVLLTLALLCGVILSVVAQAEETPSLNVTGETYNVSTDFEDENTNGEEYPKPSWAFGDTKAQNTQVTYPTVNKNTYAKYSSKGNETAENANEPEIWVYMTDFGKSAQKAGTNIGMYDYVVVDFDIGTDEYSYQDDGGEWHTVATLEEIPENKRPAENEAYKALAFKSGMQLYLDGRALATFSGGYSEKNMGEGRCYIVQDLSSGKWYVGNASTYAGSTAKVELSNKIGEFDHITFVIKVVRTADGARTTGYNLNNSTLYSFVNGAYLSQKNVAANVDAVAICALDFDGISNQDRYVLCLDNVALNFYGYRAMTAENKYSDAGVVYQSEGYGIDEYLSSDLYKTLPLWACEETVCKTFYGISEEMKFSNDGGGTYAQGTEAILEAVKNIKSGDEIVANFDIFDLYRPTAEIRTLNVKLTAGAELKLTQSYAFYDAVDRSVDGDETSYSLIFSEKKFEDLSRLNITASGNNKSADGSAAPSGGFGTNTNLNEFTYENVVGADGNKYYRHTWNKGVWSDKNPENKWVAGLQSTSGAGNLAQYDYFTWDFDIGTDAYQFAYTATLKTSSGFCDCDTCNKAETDEDVTWKTTTPTLTATVNSEAEFNAYVAEFAKYKAAKAENANLEASENFAKDYPLISRLIYTYQGYNYTQACPSGTSKRYKKYVYHVTEVTAIDAKQTLGPAYAPFQFGYRLEPNEVNALPITVTKKTDGWYIGNEKLSNEVGAFDHITFLFANTKNENDSKNLSLYIFLNGNYVTKRSVKTNYTELRVNYMKAVMTPSQYASIGYSMTFDNFASNYYVTGTDDMTGVKKIVEDITGGNTGINISDYANVLYDKDYIGSNGYVSFDGGNNFYYNKSDIDTAASTLVSGATVITSRNLNLTLASNIKTLTVKLVNGAQLSAAMTKAYDVITTDVNDYYTTCLLVLKGESLKDQNRLNITGATNNRYNDFSDATASGLSGTSGVIFNDNVGGQPYMYEAVVGADGVNKYYRHSWSGNYNPNNYENTWFPGATSVSGAGDIGQYDYLTWDFDFGTDKYNFTYSAIANDQAVSLKKTVSSVEEFEEYVAEFAKYKTAKAENADLEASETFAADYPLISQLIYSYTNYEVTEVTAIDSEQALDLAFPGVSIGWTFRGYAYQTNGTTEVHSNKEIAGGMMSVVKEGDVWCLNINGTKVPLKNEIGAFDHITYVFAISKDGASFKYNTYPNDTNGDGKFDSNDTPVVVDTGRPTINCVAYAFVNGKYVATANVTKNTYEKMYANRLRLTLGYSNLMSKGWAYITDNFASNHYANYDKTNENGIGALITAIKGGNTNVNLVDCNDVLYGTNYVDLGGWATFDGGKNVYYVDGAIANAADTLVDGATVITSKDILNFTPSNGIKSFKVELVDGAEFTLSEAASDDLWIIETVDADTVNVVKYSAEDLITFNFVDESGEIDVHTEAILPNTTLDTSAATAKLKNLFDKATATVKSATGWKIGDADADGYVAAAGDIGDTITVTPVFGDVETLATYAVTYVDEKGLTKLYGEFSEYPTAAEFYDAELTAPTNLIAEEAYKTFESHVEGAPAGATVVLLYNGPNGYLEADMGAKRLFDIARSISIDLNGRTLIQSYGSTYAYSPAMFNITGANTEFNVYGGNLYQAVKDATGDLAATIFGYKAIGASAANVTVNISDVQFVGGTLVDMGAEGITVNINRGSYHHEFRSAYALIATHKKNSYINIDGAKFTNTDGTYGIIHDYSDANTGAIQGVSHLVAKNSEFVCTNDAGTALTQLYYTMNPGSDAIFTDCKIMAKNGAIRGTLTIGEGCEVAGFDIGGNVVLASGVENAYGNDFSIKSTNPIINKTHANNTAPKGMTLGTPGLYFLAYGYYRSIGLQSQGTYWFSGNRTWATYFTTVAEDVAAAKTVTWYDTDGKTKLYEEKWIDGSTVTVKEAPAKVDLDWYDVFYTWDKTTVSGDTAINPVANLEDGKVTAYAQMTLGDDMILSVYLPKEEGVAVDVNATLDEKAYTLTVEEIGGVEYYKISWISEAGSFETVTATVNFTVTNDDYGFVAKAASADVVLDVVRYASSVVAQFDHDSVEADLVTEMVNYKEAVASYFGEYTRNDATTAFFKLHTDAECACGVEKEVSASEVADLEDLTAKGITGATYEIITLGTLNMVLKGAEGLEVSVSYKVGNVWSEEAQNYVPVVEEFFAEYDEEAEGYVVKGLTVAYIDNIMTIEVDGATGQYCLAAYINSLETLVLPEGVDRAKLTTLANALYEYAMAAEAYKHVPAAQ